MRTTPIVAASGVWTPAPSDSTATGPIDLGEDHPGLAYLVPPLTAAYDLPSASDPLGLIAYAMDHQTQSTGNQVFGVFVCVDNPGDFPAGNWPFVMDWLQTEVTDFYIEMSGGRWSPSFVQMSEVATPGDCIEAVGSVSDVTDGHNAAFIIAWNGGLFGFASPGCIAWTCAFDAPWPDQRRYALVGSATIPDHPGVSVHELGHTIHWPHSYSRLSNLEYDNPIDVMSGGPQAHAPDTPGTLALNRYAAGWIEPDEVFIYTGGVVDIDLMAQGEAGTQLVVIQKEGSNEYVAIDARIGVPADEIRSAWEGVSFHLIDQDDCCLVSLGRFQQQLPPNADGVDHVLGPGQSMSWDDATITVLSRAGTGFKVRLEGRLAPDPISGFVDIWGTGFVEEIRWLKQQGITLGCNPPLNDRFCPSDPVTRAQMASFLARALEYQASPTNWFVDDNGSTHEPNINALADNGVTLGCGGDLYCPGENVPRMQMASFLVRALGLPGSITDWFTDDDGNTHEANINALADSGITLGCEPGVFCPKSEVTRAQMAAFLYRALSE